MKVEELSRCNIATIASKLVEIKLIQNRGTQNPKPQEANTKQDGRRTTRIPTKTKPRSGSKNIGFSINLVSTHLACPPVHTAIVQKLTGNVESYWKFHEKVVKTNWEMLEKYWEIDVKIVGK